MTYGDLKDFLETLSYESLNTTVTVYVRHDDEYYGIKDIEISDDTLDVLDEGHLILTID